MFRWNLGWALERVRVPLMVFAGVGGLVLVAMRRSGVGTVPCAVVLGVGGGTALALGVWQARKSWMGVGGAFARLDAMLGWNSPVKSGARHARWHWGRVVSPWLLTVALVTGAFWVPARAVQARREPLQRPPNVQQVDEWLADLERNAVLAPENLEVFKEQLEQLKNKAPGEWYSHGTLEAAAQLKAGVESEMRSAGEQLSKLEDALDVVAEAKAAEQQSSLDLQNFASAQEQLQSALSAVASSAVPLDPQLAKKLSECAKGKTAFSSQEIKDLQERLQRARECAGCKKSGLIKGGKGEGDQSGGAPGGEGGGRSSANLRFSDGLTDLGTASEETLPQADLTKALPGDTIDEKRLAPRAESSPEGATAGSVEGRQAGSQGVWIQRPVSPPEQRRLRVFFEK
jgi:hypothetical protein